MERPDLPATSSTEHYETLLADVYDWMQGGWETRAAQSRQLLAELELTPSRPGALAVDLGAGTGYQSLPLAEAGYEVVAVDASPTMLAVLDERACLDPDLRASVSTIVADLNDFDAHVDRSPELIVCMGDTLSHLADHGRVVDLLSIMHGLQGPAGRILLSFRDGRDPPAGDARFIPIRSDPERIFTCFVEELDERRYRIHDLFHQRTETGFSQRISSYDKIRLGTDWLLDQLDIAGYRVAGSHTDRGMTIITATA